MKEILWQENTKIKIKSHNTDSKEGQREQELKTLRWMAKEWNQ